MIVALSLAVALLAGAAHQPLDCADPQAQQEMNRCAALDFERADAALNAAWSAAIAFARSDDAAGGIQGDDRPSGEARLREAQRAWLVFRDAHCALEAYEMRGGSAEPLLYNGCRARITAERTAQLRALFIDR